MARTRVLVTVALALVISSAVTAVESSLPVRTGDASPTSFSGSARSSGVIDASYREADNDTVDFEGWKSTAGHEIRVSASFPSLRAWRALVDQVHLVPIEPTLLFAIHAPPGR